MSVVRKSTWLAALVVLASNAGALGMAWMNRSGTPDAVIELTEREARVLPRDSDNTSITLRLAWVVPSRGAEAQRLLDVARLASLGFDVSRPVTNESASFYRGQAPRSAYAAFEFEGEAWRRHLASLANDADRDAAQHGSHLVLLDVGPNADALRARHPDRRQVLIAHATVGLVFDRAPGKDPALYGHLDQAYPVELTVPPHLRDRVRALPPPATSYSPSREWRGNPLLWAPRYRLRVAWGRALEPWLVAFD